MGGKIFVSKESFNSVKPDAITVSNYSFVNVIREEGGNLEELLHKDAVLSYYLHYYVQQYKNGNFSQVVWNTQADYEFLANVAKGLEQIGAVDHLSLLNKQVEVLKDLDEAVLEAYLESNYFGTNPTRDLLNNDVFFDLDENLERLHASWLKAHPDLRVLKLEEMYEKAEALLGKEIER